MVTLKELTKSKHVLIAIYSLFPVILLIALFRDVILLFSTPVAVGFDGYYYVLQVEGLIGGQSYFQTETPLILYLLAGLKVIWGDTVSAIKVGAMFLHLLLCISVGFLLFLGTKKYLAGIAGSTYVATAGLHHFMISEFINHLGAIVFILLGTCFGVYAAQNKKKWPYIISSICLLISIGCHRSSAFIVIGLGIAGFLAFLFSEAISKWNTAVVLVSVSMILCLYFFPYFAAAQTIFEFPYSFSREFSIVPRLPITRFTIYDSLNVLWSSIFVILITFWHKKISPNKGHNVFVAVAFISLLVNLNVFINPDLILIGVAGRLQTLIYIQVGLLVPYSLWLVYTIRSEFIWYLLAFSLPLTFLSSSLDLPYGLHSSYLNNRQRLIVALPLVFEQIPFDGIIIAPHGDQFVVTSVTGMPAQQSFPSDARFRPIFWMLRQVPKNYVTRTTKEVYIETQGTATILVNNDELGEFWGRIEPQTKRQILASNPHLYEFLSGYEVF